MAQFYMELAALLRSGVPLLRSLELLGSHSTNPALKQITQDLHARVTEGDSLADAMARHPRAFTDLSRSIVRAGGEGGFLEEALERIAKFTDQQAELKSRVDRGAGVPDLSRRVRRRHRHGAGDLLRAASSRCCSRGCAPAANCRRSPSGCCGSAQSIHNYGLFIAGGHRGHRVRDSPAGA